MRFLLFLNAVALLCAGTRAADLTLTIKAPANEIRVGAVPPFEITLANTGQKTWSLVLPGDGSDCQWRTPLVGWSVLPVGRPELKHPAAPPPETGARCGNINSIKLADLFTLKPGESRTLNEWAGQPAFSKPGQYRVVFYYQNIPDQKLAGVPLGRHSGEALEKIKASDACLVVSNEVVVVVLEKKP